MKRLIGFSVVALTLLAAGCGGGYQSSSAPPPGYATAPPQAPDEHGMVYAPSAPPPSQAEMIPPPPDGNVQAVYWVPGNWRWYGTADGHSGWQWTAGHYVDRPSQTASYQPGHWQHSSAGYLWVDGYWR
jgi:hypothetical protein